MMASATLAECQRLMAIGAVSEAVDLAVSLSFDEAHSLPGCELRAYLANSIGDFPAAEIALRQMLVHRSDTNGQLLLASNLYKQGCLVEATALLQALIDQQPDCLRAHFNLAQMYLAQQDFVAALPALQECLAHQPDDITLLNQVATAYCQLDQPLDAKIYLERVLRLNPHDVDALNNYGVCQLKAADYVAAIHSFATAMRVDEGHLPSRSNLAITLCKAERYAEALVYFEAYLALAPLDADAHYHAGVAALMLSKLDQAAAYFQAVLQQDKDSIASLLNLAAIALKQDASSNALACYQRVLAIDPNQAIASYMQAALLGSKTPSQAPSEYVSALFDQYARHFDQHLLHDLAYQTPQQLRKLYDRLHLAKPARLLDLGCGTGLSGMAFSDIAEHMIGIDLSEQMLVEARLKGIYQTCLHTDIHAYLAQVEIAFELILAADVFVYVGDLRETLKLCAAHLSESGVLLCSLEIAQAADTPYALTPTGRFQHSLPAVLEQARAVGLHCLAKDTVTLRTQAGAAVKGSILVLVKKT